MALGLADPPSAWYLDSPSQFRVSFVFAFGFISEFILPLGFSSQNPDQASYEEVGVGSRDGGEHILVKPGYTNHNKSCEKYWRHVSGILECFDVVVDQFGVFDGVAPFPNEYRSNNFGYRFRDDCGATRNRFESAAQFNRSHFEWPQNVRLAVHPFVRNPLPPTPELQGCT